MDDSAIPPENKTEDVDGRTISGPKHMHDAHGHFVHSEQNVRPEQSPHPESAEGHHINPISQFLHDETAIHHTNDDELIDVHVGNPLKKIQTLLEEIKRQKAFTFDIKGSLGVAGIFLVLGTFGIFGGTRALCSKGIQTKVGTITSLSFTEDQSDNFFRDFPILNMFMQKKILNRTILITGDHHVVHLIFKDHQTPKYYVSSGVDFAATGDYDSCSETLTVTEPTAVQPMQ